MLNPTWLNTFKTLVDIGHFTKTSEQLFMTQPGVSQHIQKLEAACGHKLLIRYNKTFELTEQGRLMYVYAQQLVESEKQLLDSLNIDAPYQGEIKIACSGSLALSLFPKLLELQVDNPDLSIHLEVAPNQKILNEVHNGNIDIGVVTHKPQESFYEIEKLGVESLYLVLPNTYQSITISSQDLIDLGIIRHPDADHYLSLYLNRCEEKGWKEINIEKIKTVSYINQLNQILLPIAKGMGFTVLPKSAVQNFALIDKIAIHQPAERVTEPLYCVRKRYKPKTQRVISMIDQLKKWIKE